MTVICTFADHVQQLSFSFARVVLVMASPGHKDPKQASHVQELRKRLNQCWELDVDWKLYPSILKEICRLILHANNYLFSKNKCRTIIM